MCPSWLRPQSDPCNLHPQFLPLECNQTVQIVTTTWHHVLPPLRQFQSPALQLHQLHSPNIRGFNLWTLSVSNCNWIELTGSAIYLITSWDLAQMNSIRPPLGGLPDGAQQAMLIARWSFSSTLAWPTQKWRLKHCVSAETNGTHHLMPQYYIVYSIYLFLRLVCCGVCHCQTLVVPEQVEKTLVSTLNR